MTIQLEKLATSLDINSSGLKTGLAAATAGIGATVAAIGLAVKATFDWADDLDSLQDVIGGTNKQVAALNFVARKSKVGVDTLSKGMVILEKGLVKADGSLDTTGKSLRDWGINVKDANGNLKDQIQLTDEISRKYRQLSTQQERVNFLTEVFGKSGANLVDFFDTLAQEGGIDAVTKKVEAYGLAIDPARYEQFNRNLEELKLIGTGIAVQFTEKLMPVLERLLGWFSDIAPAANKAFQEGGLGGLADFIVKELGNLDVQIAAKLDSVNWSALGTKFGDWVDQQLENAFQSSGKSILPRFVVSLTNGLQDAFLHAALGANPQAAWAAFFDNVHREGDSQVRTFFINWEVTWTNAIRTFFNGLEVGGSNAVRNFFNKWEVSWTNGLRKIWNDVIAWLDKINRAIAGVSFAGSNLTLPMMSAGNSSGRATGGAVASGQSYNILELGKAEVFTPNTSGRIDPLKQMDDSIFQDILSQLNRLPRQLAQEVVKVRA